MRRPPRILVLDFGASHIAGALFAMNRAGQLALERFVIEECEVGSAGDDIAEENRGNALARLVEKANWHGPCAMAVPAHLTLVKLIKIPAVAPAQRPQVLAFEVAQKIPYPIEDVCWGSYHLGNEGAEDEFVVAAAKAEAMTTLCAAVGGVNLMPERAMPGGLALWHAWRYQYGNDSDSALLVDIGARSTQVIFVTQQRCFARTLPLGGNVITQAIMTELNLEFTAAEALKMSVLSEQTTVAQDAALHAVVGQAADAFGHRLQQELTRAMLGYTRQSGAVQPTQILLTGGCGQLPGLAAQLSAKLHLPVWHYDVRRRVDGATVLTSRLAVLVGLAAAVLVEKAPALNLLPPTIQQAVMGRKARPWWAAAAALLIIAAVPPVWHFHALARELREENARLEKQLGPLRELMVRNAETQTRLTTLSREIAALKHLVAAKTSWEEFFAGLQGDLAAVDDVWLDRLQMVNGDSVEQYAEAEKTLPLRLTVSGRLIDTRHPPARVSPDSHKQVKELLTRIEASRFVAALEGERFDNSTPGILKFDFTMVLKAEEPL